MFKMFSLRSLKRFAVGAVIAVAPIAASALTVTPADIRIVEAGTGDVVANSFVGNTFGFSWTGTGGPANRAGIYTQFSVSDTFSLTLTTYGPSGNNAGAVSLFDSFVVGGGAAQSIGTTLIGTAGVGSVLFANLAAGEYTLFSNQFNAPSDGSASFTISAVPLPLGIAFLATGLGALVLVGRRKAVAA